MIKYIEIRCCCDAGKILGYVPVPKNSDKNATIRYPLRSRVNPEEAQMIVEYVDLEVGIVDGIGFNGHRALKSNHTPIETLRRIYGFVEYTR